MVVYMDIRYEFSFLRYIGGDIVKKVFALLLSVIVLLSSFVFASANSGPTHMDADEGMGLTVDPGCPIEVTHEDLHFDFSDTALDWVNTYGSVTASYEMVNPTGEDVSVTMAFPYSCTLSDPEHGVSSVLVNGESISYDTYYGAFTDDIELSSISFDDILSNVVTEIPEYPEDCMLYEFYIPEGELSGHQRLYLSVTFDDPGFTCISTASGFGSEEGTFLLTEWIYAGRGDNGFSLLVCGDTVPEFTINVSEDYEATDSALKPTESYGTAKYSSRGCTLREFIKSCVNEYIEAPAEFSDAYYSAVLDSFKYFEDSHPVIPAYEVINTAYYKNRLAMAVYTVDFAAGEAKNVSVTCGINGEMNRSDGYVIDGSTATYTYLSNPAKNWASFGTLSITVTLPEDVPLYSSVPELTYNENDTYEAKLDGLPEENIVITLGSHNAANREPSITLDGLLEAAPNIFTGLGLAVAAAVIISALFLAIRAVLRRMKNK